MKTLPNNRWMTAGLTICVMLAFAVPAHAVTHPLAVALNPADGSGGTVTAGFSPTSLRTEGATYTITATPKTTPAPGFVFDGWTVGGAQPGGGLDYATNLNLIGITQATDLEKPSLKFIFHENLTLTANFTANKFAAVAGIYTGLIRSSATLPDRAPAGAGAEDGTTPAMGTEGLFTATVQTTGAFSGTLKIDGLALGVAGSFDNTGVARFGTNRATTVSVLRPDKPSLIVALNLDLTPPPGGTEKITGTIKQFYRSVQTAESNIDADRGHYNATVNVSTDYLTVTGSTVGNGVYTAVFKARTSGQPAALTLNDYPQGDGFANVTISKTGLVSFSGLLADNTVLTASGPLSKNDKCPIFVQLYNKLGFLSTMVELAVLADSHFTAPAVLWSRPFQSVQHYPYGWDEVITTDLFGAKYAVTNLQSVLPNLVDPDRLADLDFTDGLLAAPVNKDVKISTADGVTKVPTEATSTYSLTITRTNGRFNGSFTHTDASSKVTKPTYQGIIYQRGSLARGYGYFLTTTPAVKDYTGQGGRVSLKAQ